MLRICRVAVWAAWGGWITKLCARRSTMPDTTIKKVEARSSPRGEMGQKDLSPASAFRCASGLTSPVELKVPTTRDEETVGYVISGSAKLELEGQTSNCKSQKLMVGAAVP